MRLQIYRSLLMRENFQQQNNFVVRNHYLIRGMTWMWARLTTTIDNILVFDCKLHQTYADNVKWLMMNFCGRLRILSVCFSLPNSSTIRSEIRLLFVNFNSIASSHCANIAVFSVNLFSLRSAFIMMNCSTPTTTTPTASQNHQIAFFIWSFQKHSHTLASNVIELSSISVKQISVVIETVFMYTLPVTIMCAMWHNAMRYKKNKQKNKQTATKTNTLQPATVCKPFACTGNLMLFVCLLFHSVSEFSSHLSLLLCVFFSTRFGFFFF